MARKKQGEGGGGESWMNTYADMVTLLLTFFVMLYSMSSINEEKWQALVKAFTGNEPSSLVVIDSGPGEGDQMGTLLGSGTEELVGGSGLETQETMPGTFDELYEYLKGYTEKANMQDAVEIIKGDGVVYIRFRNNVFFDGDSSVLRESSFPLLDFLSQSLNNVNDQVRMININGHTATVPSVKNKTINDRRLSSERASSVAIYMEGQKIDPKKILAIGYGKNYPVDTNDTAAGRARNRRVDMMIVSTESNFTNEQLLNQFLTGTYDPEKYPAEGSGADVLEPNTTDVPDPNEEPVIPPQAPEGEGGEDGQAPEVESGVSPFE